MVKTVLNTGFMSLKFVYYASYKTLQVGSMSDLSAGPMFLGLAHYTEHAMYMGSKEYPRFSEYQLLLLHIL